MSAAGSHTSVLDAPTVRPLGRPRRASRPRRWAVVAAGLAAALALSGCAAGIRAETSRERPTVDGIGAAVGTLTIRNAYVAGPGVVGGDVPVLLAVFNDGNEPDRLVSVSSPSAGGASVPADTTITPGGQQLFYTADRTPRLTGLTSPAALGTIVPVVLTFERAGELRLSLPVAPAPPGVLPSAGSAAPSASTTPSGAPSATPPSAGASAAPPAGAAPTASASPPASISP